MNKKLIAVTLALILALSFSAVGFASEEDSGGSVFADWEGTWNSISHDMMTNGDIIDALYALAEEAGEDGDAFMSEYSGIMLQPIAAAEISGDTISLFDNIFDENGEATGEVVFEGTYSLVESDEITYLFELADEVEEGTPEYNFKYIVFTAINDVAGAKAFQMTFVSEENDLPTNWLPTFIDSNADSASIVEYLTNFLTTDQLLAASESFAADPEGFMTQLSDYLMPIAPLFE